MDPTTGPRKTNFGYNRFADLFYYLLAHMPLDCAADVYDAEYVAEMAGELGVSPQVPQRLTEYYQEHFDRLNIINFFPLAADNIRHLREGLASCGQLTEEDMSRFVDPLLEICERVSGPFYKWWEQHHAESAERKEKVYDRFSALAARFGLAALAEGDHHLVGEAVVGALAGDVAPADKDPKYTHDFAIWQRTCSELWTPLLEKAHCQLIITAHQHEYRCDAPGPGRSWTHIVGGGPRLEEKKFPTVIEGKVEGGRLVVNVHNILTGQLQESFTFKPR